MKTTFIYRPSLEFERLFGILSSAAKGLYQEHGFLVLPYRLTKEPKSVFLPAIKNFKPINYLTELKTTSDFRDIPLEKTDQVSKILKALKATDFKVEKIDSKNTARVEKKWQLIQPQFEDYFLQIFPQYRLYRINLEIYWTRYGALVSFGGLKSKGKKAKLKIFLRDDMGLPQIVEGFLSSLYLAKTRRVYKYSWLQREAIIDFLIRETKLSRLFPDYVPTLSPKKNLKELQKHYQNSSQYLKKLGFSIKPGLSIHKNRLLVGGQVPKFTFSPAEEEILKRLVTTPNEPVSYYDLGDLIWKDDLDRFSLWALSRLIFKIRNKLRKNGLSPEHVKNLRGRGYYYTSQP